MAEGFAAIPTWMIRDTENVSRYAIAVYGVLATYAGLAINAPGQPRIAREARYSERKVRDALIELEQLGVVERSRHGGKGKGRFTDEYRLSDRPPVSAPRQQPARDAGSAGEQPAQNDGATGTSEQTTPSIEVDRTEVDITPARDDLEALFSEAWAHWPKKTERKKSLDKFRSTLKKYQGQDPRALVGVIQHFGDAYAATTETRFVPALCVWLNGERWTDPLPTGNRNATAAAQMVANLQAMGGDPHALGQ